MSRFIAIQKMTDVDGFLFREGFESYRLITCCPVDCGWVVIERVADGDGEVLATAEQTTDICYIPCGKLFILVYILVIFLL